jgi:Na+-driven multidrug efflux pump
VIVTYVIKRPSFCLQISFNLNYKPDWKVIKRIYDIAIPSMLESLVFSGGRLISQAFATVLGTFSIAANSVATNLVGWVNIVNVAYVTASPPVVAKAIGAGDKKEVKRTANTAFYQSWVLMLLFAGVIFVMATPLCALYSKDAEIVKFAAHLVRLDAFFSILMYTPSFLFPAIFRASGDAKFPMYVNNFNMLAFRLALGYYLSVMTPIGIAGIWYAMFFDWVIRTVLYFRHYYSDKWLKPCGMYEPKKPKIQAAQQGVNN